MIDFTILCDYDELERVLSGRDIDRKAALDCDFLALGCEILIIGFSVYLDVVLGAEN
jgi:hypothetical protein